ncbi:MAG: asparagine synthase (glutamine-hydrolyzing) [Inconstantimicrobium porci]|uniref:asparagine synthase (glutamine-hydrolyzing) n=1 Tax=Inconstantimicrobium porci TaxID=2652291 RepID=UPI002409529A|nr:asparagine synthase (glutamine-hydrolyzing) [Inconstantimicrobium porci]MDD6770393.1 asparagine synthase (glutamine-hydrolyzing) [Inconstantimicrobium porci]MDY5910668.1 asparagine synthase (glutamine-hydrolyzing) [Inconstantimicrobium porci]
MCGIAGWVDFKNNLSLKYNIIKDMTETLKKRGPDNHGYYIKENVLFGHRRLIVVDPEGGAQPMVKKITSREYCIIYNGELYNTEDLRKELYTEGYSFTSYSDTEVLLTSYICWGKECVKKLNGIFAFAIYDDLNKSVFIARDHLGVKPLFYTKKDSSLIFGSEIKTLLAHPDVEAVVDRDGLTELFSLGPAVKPGTAIFKNIKEVPPGHYLYLTSDSKCALQKYWDISAEENTESVDEAIEHTRFLLTDAIKRQLVGDVPLCTFLSGGLDSSAISAIAADDFRVKGKQLTTYSIDYEDNSKFFKATLFEPSSDKYYAQMMADVLHTDHRNVVLQHDRLVAALKDAVIARDLPGMADVDSSLLLFCKEVRKDFIIALSGECADEIFGGYPWFTKKELINSDTFPWSRFVPDRKKILSDDFKSLKIEDCTNENYLHTLREVPHLDNETPEQHRMRELFYLNIKWFMMTLLNRKDRCSMINSLEVRVPFADHRIVQYAFNLPDKIKFLNGREKGLLRKSLEGILPQEIIYRKKSPYPKTHNPVYTDLVCSEMSRVLNDNSSPILPLIDTDFVKNMILTKGSSYTNPWYGQLMTGPQLLAYLYQINVWLKEYKIKLEV